MCSCMHYIPRFYFSTQSDSLCLSIQNFKLFAFNITINLFPSSDKIFYTFLVPCFCVSLIFITASWMWISFPMKVKVSVLWLCNHMDYSPGQNTGVGSLSLLHWIFPTQGSNPGLPHCRQILYQLSHQGSLFQWNMNIKKRRKENEDHFTSMHQLFWNLIL